MTRRSKARYGKVRHGCYGAEWLGEVRPGRVGSGEAWYCKVGTGMARFDFAELSKIKKQVFEKSQERGAKS